MGWNAKTDAAVKANNRANPLLKEPAVAVSCSCASGDARTTDLADRAITFFVGQNASTETNSKTAQQRHEIVVAFVIIIMVE
jgi:hypothetical protein